MHIQKLTVTLIACAMVACTGTKKETVAETKEAVVEVAQLKFKKDAVKAIFSSYEELRDAFVATDFEATNAVISKLKEAFQQEQGTESIISIVDEMASATDIEAQRASFFSLNKELEKFMSGEVETGEVYKAYCPMAFDNTGGFWLTSKKEVLNPYFGDKMLKCGYIQDSIK